MEFFKQSEIETLRKAIISANNKSSIPLPPENTAYEIANTYNFLFEECGEKKVTKLSAKSEQVYIKLMALRYGLFSIIIPRDQGPDYFLLSSLFTQISNTIVAITELVNSGFDYQAFSLMRNLMELFMTLLTVIESPKKRTEFRQATDAEKSRKVWHQFFNKKHFIEMLDSYNKHNSEFRKAYTQWVDSTYAELSSFAHNDYMYLICYNFAIGENELNPTNLWGEYVSRRDIAYQRLLEIIAPADILINSMLRDDNIDFSLDDFYKHIEDPAALIGSKHIQVAISKVCLSILMDNIREKSCD